MITAELTHSDELDINAQAGDILYIHGHATLVENTPTGNAELVLSVEGIEENSVYFVPAGFAIGTGPSLEVHFVYNVPDDREVNISLTAEGGYILDDESIDYILISADDSVLIDTPALNVGLGFGLFLATMFMFVWFFRSKK